MAGFYVAIEGTVPAFKQRRLFNAIDSVSASKIDLIVRKTAATAEWNS